MGIKNALKVEKLTKIYSQKSSKNIEALKKLSFSSTELTKS